MRLFKIVRRFFISASCFEFVLYFPSIAFSQTATIQIETRIADINGAAQPGVKSIHTIDIDYAKRLINDSFSTGVTKIGDVVLSSVRDGFKVSNVQIVGKVAALTARGQTASGVLLLPNIDYRFDITVDMQSREVLISGCHDGYPSYKVSVLGKIVYQFQQRSLVDLLGNCDIVIPPKTAKF